MNRSPAIRVALAALPLACLASSPGCKSDKPWLSLGPDRSADRTSRQLVTALESQNPDRRRKALLSLVGEPTARGPEAYQALDLIARTDRDGPVRRAAIAVLASYTDGRPVDTLVKLLHDHEHQRTVRPVDEGVRWDAVTALGDLAARNVIPAEQRPSVVRSLARLLYESPDHQVRVSAAHALRHFYSRRSLAALIGVLSAQDFGVAYEARASLRYMTGLEQDMHLAAWQEWLDKACFQETADRPQTNRAGQSSGREVRGEP